MTKTAQHLYVEGLLCEQVLRLRASEPEVLWEPTAETKKRANITHYLEWLASRDLHFRNYEELRRWSVGDLEKFWETIWEYFDVMAFKPYSRVLSRRKMPGAKWFAGAELNYAENVLREKDQRGPAIICASEGTEKRVDVSWRELRTRTSSVAASLTEMGVKKGDRVSAYLPNIAEAVVAFLACSSVGATWASCSPDFGAPSVIDRLKQIDPKVLIAADGYRYGGKWFDRLPVLREIQKGLPTLKKMIIIRKREGEFRGEGLRDLITWEDIPRVSSAPIFEPVPFDHPLWVLYSSGTTGLPKPIVHGHGGILLEHLKALSLHNDLRASDRFFWFTSTGWMMWNYLIGGLLLGSTILLYDGSPGFPDLDALWRLADSSGMTFFGTSAAYVNSCMKVGLRPGETHELRQLRGVGSTGSPLSRDGFRWVDGVKRDVWLASISGGTDLCTAFVGGCPTLPVRAGEIQCRSLGADVQSFDERGKSVVGQVGELVLTSPMPSMPLFFWGDPDGNRYRESYFAM
ncbi:MAG: acetoacetate--CoA ligase, partial [Thaumarchaeota archaeon]